MFVFVYSCYFVLCVIDNYDDVFVVWWHVCVCIFIIFCSQIVIVNDDDVFILWWHVCVYLLNIMYYICDW